MATAPQTFEQFRKLHPGVKNAATLKAAWDRLQSQRATKAAEQQAAQQRAALEASSATPPRFVPGDLDESAQADVGQLTHQRDTALADAQRAYAEETSALNSQIPLIAQARTEGLQNTDRSHAARGTFRSGIRAVDRGKVETDTLRETTRVQDLLAQAAARHSGARSAATGGYTAGYNQIRAGSNARAYENWASRVQPTQAQVSQIQLPGPARPAAPAAPKGPEMTYARFQQLHGNRDTPALKAAYNKRFGGR